MRNNLNPDGSPKPGMVREGMDARDMDEPQPWEFERAYSAGHSDFDEEQAANDKVDADEDLVEPNFACPSCGERRVDWLAIGEAIGEDYELVTCGSCKREYRLADGGGQDVEL